MTFQIFFPAEKLFADFANLEVSIKQAVLLFYMNVQRIGTRTNVKVNLHMTSHFQYDVQFSNDGEELEFG